MQRGRVVPDLVDLDEWGKMDRSEIDDGRHDTIRYDTIPLSMLNCLGWIRLGRQNELVL
jgi:hypothetical protein